VVGASVTLVSFGALKNNVHRRTLPIALIPAIFSAHLFASAIVWLGFDGNVSTGIQTVATNFYLFIAFVLWPTYIPAAILFVEPDGLRRLALSLFVVLGVITSVQFFSAIVSGNGTATSGNLFIDFHVSGTPNYSGALYFVVTCGSALLSGQRAIVVWGWLNVFAVTALVVSANHGLPSLWCFWAAITSVCVLWFIRSIKLRKELGLPWPWSAQDDRQHKVVS